MPHDSEFPAGEIADDLFRRESARLVAMLTGQFGTQNLQLAEDAVQEALVRALQTWPYRGVPENPAAWLTRTARNLALDQLRREQNFRRKEDEIAHEQDRWISSPAEPDENADTFPDDTLRMMFVCFHPLLSAEAQTALALRTLCGLSPSEIAAAFLTSEAAIAKRLVRARQRIRELNLPFSVPAPGELPERLDGVLATLYLLFNEGYKASGGDRLVRGELCHEAIRLTALLLEHPATCEPRTCALLAVMCLSASRLSARTDDAGNLLRLHEQDRAAWDQQLIHRGLRYLARSAAGGTISSYHLEAGIAACHSTAADHADTDWSRILTLYDAILVLHPTPITSMNRAVAVARVHGPQAGLDALSAITPGHALDAYYLYHATFGTFSAELGELSTAIIHFRQAEILATIPTERDFITRRIHECGG